MDELKLGPMPASPPRRPAAHPVERGPGPGALHQLPSRPPYKVFVANVSYAITDSDLAEFFHPSKVSVIGISLFVYCEFN